MSVGERIKTARKKADLTQQQLGDKLGIGKSSISEWEAGKRPVPIDTLEIIAQVLDVGLDYLLEWPRPLNDLDVKVVQMYPDFVPGKNRLPTRDESDGTNRVIPLPSNAIPYTPMPRIPIIGSVRAGAGGLAMEEPSGYELADVRNPEEYFFLRVVGDSMSPEINEGDLALIHKQPDVESGELAVAVIDGEEGTIKKVIKKQGSLILHAFNSAHPPRVFIGKEMNAVRIVGKVTRTVRIW